MTDPCIGCVFSATCEDGCVRFWRFFGWWAAAMRGNDPRPRKKKHGPRGRPRKPVVQMDLAGQVVREWGSIAEAARELGVHGISIIRTCRGEQYAAGGWRWRYR